MKSRICDLFGIEHPIVSGGMQWLSKAELVAAVSNAGGLGMLSATTHPTKESLVAEIIKTKEMTNKLFGVNISMLPGSAQIDMVSGYFEAVVEQGVKVVETSGRSPEQYVPLLHEAGVKIIHKVPAVRYAKKAEQVGVDAVTIVGFECGGHPGMDDVTIMSLVPRTVDEVNIPVLAGGGIADARGYVAALALGADGVVMGTRFLLSRECGIHERFKEYLCAAKETDTRMILYSIRNPIRAIHNEAVNSVAELEHQGATLEQLMTIISGKNGRRCWYEGDLQGGMQAVGQCVGLVNEIKSVREIIDEIISGSEGILKRLQ